MMRFLARLWVWISCMLTPISIYFPVREYTGDKTVALMLSGICAALMIVVIIYIN